MKKLKEMIMKDLGWKLLSLGIAIALWFMVINIENPVETRNYTVMLGLQNITDVKDKGYTISNQEELENTKVTIKIKGQRMSLDRLGQRRSEISASVDLSKITKEMLADGNNKVYISTKLPANLGESYEIVSVSPGSLNIISSKINVMQSEVTINTTGQIAAGYVMGKPDVLPENVEVVGVNEDLQKLARVGGDIDVTEMNSDYSGKIKINAYDAEGNIIEGLKLSEQEVDVNIVINKSKTVQIDVEYQGVPAEGYMVKGISWSPTSIDLVGNEDVLNGITKIKLPETSIEGLTESVSKSYDIREFLPMGVSVKNGFDINAVVDIEIVKSAEKELFVSDQSINVKGEPEEGLEAVIDDSIVTFYIHGEESAVNSVDENTIEGEVDVTGLVEGGHIVSIKFDLPEGVEIIGDHPRTTVTIVRNQDEPSNPTENEIENQTDNEQATSGLE